MNEIERIRRFYAPERVTLLLVGESAPAGGTFFYLENSTLYFETCAAFTSALPAVFAGRDFLDVFRGVGCYLDDLCLEPVNDLPESVRKRKRAEAEAGLARRLRRYEPLMIIAIGKTTAAPHVHRALESANLSHVRFAEVPFPGRAAHKEQFRREMESAVRSAAEWGFLAVDPPRWHTGLDEPGAYAGDRHGAQGGDEPASSPTRQRPVTASRPRTQNITVADIKSGRIRIPPSSKALFPGESAIVELDLRGQRRTCRWNPRYGPDKERSGVLSVGVALMRTRVQQDEQLGIRVSKGHVYLE